MHSALKRVKPQKANNATFAKPVATAGHCLFSNRKGLGTSLSIMRLATIDTHSHKVHTKLYKIPKFGVNRPNSKQDTAI